MEDLRQQPHPGRDARPAALFSRAGLAGCVGSGNLGFTFPGQVDCSLRGLLLNLLSPSRNDSVQVLINVRVF